MTEANLKRYPLLISPADDESLPGFVHRLAARNATRTGWLNQIIGIRNNQVEWSDDHFARLSVVSGQAVDALRALHCPIVSGAEASSSNGYSGVSFKGYIIDRHMLDRMAMRYCPACMAEHGYHKAIWFLRFVTACPIHRRRLIDQCPHCSRPIAWHRSEFLACRCRSALPMPTALGPDDEIPDNELDGIRALYERCQVPHGGAVTLDRLPDAIKSLDLEDLCVFLWLVGSTRDDFVNYRSRSGPMQKTLPDSHLVLQHGVELASSWPDGFHKWLDRFWAAPVRGRAAGLGTQFKLLEGKLRNVRQDRVRLIIQEAVRDFAVENGIYIHERQRLLVPPGSTPTTNLITLKEVASILGCASDTAKEIALAQGWIDESIKNKRGVKAIPEDVVLKYRHHLKPELEFDDARSQLNVGLGTLRALLEGGYLGRARIQPRHQRGSLTWSITQEDIDKLKQKFVDAVRPLRNAEPCRLVSLRALSGRHYIHGLTYGELLFAVFNGELVPRDYHRTLKVPAGLLLDEIEAIEFYTKKPTCRRYCLTPDHASSLTSVPVHRIRRKVELGLIDAEWLGTGRRVCLLSYDGIEWLRRDSSSDTRRAPERCRPEAKEDAAA